MSEVPASETPALVSVAVPVALDQAFSYAVPPELTPRPGARVVVPFGRRVLVGVVRRSETAALETAAAPAPGRLRALIDCLDPPERPALTGDLVDLCEWIADYYLAPIGEVFRLALPGAAMGVDARRAAIAEAGRAIVLAASGPLLASAARQDESAATPEGFHRGLLAGEPLEDADLRLLAVLAEARAPIAAAKLRKLEPPIPAVLRRLEALAERGLILVDTGEADDRQARTEAHFRRTDRLRGGADEAAIQQAVGRSKQRRALLDFLELQGKDEWTPLSELRGPFPRARALLGPLIEAGLVVEEGRLRALDPFAAIPESESEESGALTLTEDQQQALAGLLASLASQRYAGALLHGVTGSGKTEVYLRLIAEVRRQGGGAIVLVPEIALTPQLAQRFRRRFGDEVAVLHSGLTAQQRLDVWGHIRAGRRPIVIGARSAVFAPVPGLRVIVVDEEHDGSFKQEEGVRYNARDVALVRARSLDAVVVLGSATPSLESWQNVHDGRLALWSLRSRPQTRSGAPIQLPAVEIVNLREHLPDPETLLCARLREQLKATTVAGEQAILFLNRRGYTTALGCKTCGSFQQCPDCSAPSMTYHLGRNRLLCHLCGHIEAAPERCLACGSASLEHGAAGTERVEVAIAADLPGVRVARLDRDTSRGKALLELLGRFRRREIDVLIGTQMLSKGHDFPGVTLVGVLRADHGLGLPDFRATERVFQLLTQVAGRAGRGDRPGRVVIQTWAPDHPAIRFAQTHDVEGFVAHELAARAAAGNPPAGHLALLRVSGEDRGRVDARARILAEFARDLVRRMGEGEPPVQILGPVDSPIERINRRHRVQVLLRARARGPLRWLLKHARHRLGAEGRGKSATLARVDVDPYGLL